MPGPELIKIGIAGLDEILCGGIPRGNVILLEGAIGCGKTTLGVNGNGMPEARSTFHVFTAGLHRENLTAVMVVEASAYDPGHNHNDVLPEESIADTVIRLRMEESQRAVSRSVEGASGRGDVQSREPGDAGDGVDDGRLSDRRICVCGFLPGLGDPAPRAPSRHRL
jgi:KaiC/GvpD/RAD55 family RecA-like ATPase